MRINRELWFVGSSISIAIHILLVLFLFVIWKGLQQGELEENSKGDEWVSTIRGSWLETKEIAVHFQNEDQSGYSKTGNESENVLSKPVSFEQRAEIVQQVDYQSKSISSSIGHQKEAITLPEQVGIIPGQGSPGGSELNNSSGSKNGSQDLIDRTPSPVIPNQGRGSPLHPRVKAAKSIVYVLDISASMGKKNKFQDAALALINSLRQLNSKSTFQIVVYHSSAEVLQIDRCQDLVSYNEQNLSEVCKSLEKIQPQGASNHVEGLKTALALEPDAIFLLTDGDDLTELDLKSLKRFPHKLAVIYPVILSSETQKKTLSAFSKLARMSNGKMIYRSE